jgi:hypothetical protein
MTRADEPLLPPDPDGVELLHDRQYSVRSFLRADGSILLRGAVRDLKPAGLYVADDPAPLPIHHMIVDLVIAMPSLEITAAEVVFETHPHSLCPSITEHYHNLVGLSIARGFTHKVRELFGGPRGCTHTTALLQAMAPVAVQTLWSVRAVNARASGEQMVMVRDASPEELQAIFAPNMNTCHVWDEDGEFVAARLAGEIEGPPLWIRSRYAELGRSLEGWGTATAE